MFWRRFGRRLRPRDPGCNRGYVAEIRRVTSCDLVSRSDNLVGVHGRSSEGRVGHEAAEAGRQRQRLGPAELREATVTLRLWGGQSPHGCLLKVV